MLTVGAQKLASFMAGSGTCQNRAAKQLGLSPASIYTWTQGTKRPSALQRELLYKWCGIKPIEWLDEPETDRLAKVKRFKMQAQ